MKKPTLKQYILGIPAISAAILARFVRFITKVKGTRLERYLMKFYYSEERRLL